MIYHVLTLSILLPVLFIIIIKPFQTKSNTKSSSKSYPFIGQYLSLYANIHRVTQWTADLVLSSPSLTSHLHFPFGEIRIITGNPSVIKHILKTNFTCYDKGDIFRTTLYDLLGDGIFNVDGDEWKFQRQLSSHEFNTKSLRHFVEDVVDTELNERLIPILTAAATNDTVLDMQDLLQRFAFDNICMIAFGYDPEYLTPSLPESKFAVAFEDAVRISGERFRMITPVLWKLKRVLNLGSEKRLKEAVFEIPEFATNILNQKKQETSIQTVDLLSRFISSGHSDERFVTDMVISYILAGRDSTSAALTWFFWLVYKNPLVENEVVKEIEVKLDSRDYTEVKDMVYTHASLCESMRLYPPVPVDSKMANSHDVLPDGTTVKKGTLYTCVIQCFKNLVCMMVTYHPYAMGRAEELWGTDWMDFRPERWLEKDETTEKVRFVARDPYMYPVFQAGPRICLGKEMAFLQMKRIVAGVLGRFKIVPAIADDGDPVFVAALTSKMKGGFLVGKIQDRKR